MGEARHLDMFEGFEKFSVFESSVDLLFIAPEEFFSGIREILEIKVFEEDFLEDFLIVVIDMDVPSEEFVGEVSCGRRERMFGNFFL